MLRERDQDVSKNVTTTFRSTCFDFLSWIHSNQPGAWNCMILLFFSSCFFFPALGLPKTGTMENQWTILTPFLSRERLQVFLFSPFLSVSHGKNNYPLEGLDTRYCVHARLDILHSPILAHITIKWSFEQKTGLHAVMRCRQHHRLHFLPLLRATIP